MRKIGDSIIRCIEYRIVPIFGWLCNSKNRYVNVIYYHDIVQGDGYSYMQTNINVFKQQMEWLVKEGYETLRFDDLHDDHICFKKKRVLIAFDDGWLSNYTEIFDYMKSSNLKYNVFLTIGEIGVNQNYLTWDMVRRMHDSGLCGFGVHTYTHPSMADFSLIDYSHEVNDADSLFEQELGYCPRDFCYPFGYYSEESNQRLEKESGYQHIYTSRMMYSYEQNGCVIFGRNGISTEYPMNYFKKIVKGYVNWHKVFDEYINKYILNLYHIIKPCKSN